MNSNLKQLLEELNNSQHSNDFNSRHDRVLLIDGLNLFFRSFSVLNNINPRGIHIGGLGGFLRSLSSLIKEIKPTSCYIIFDGPGSTVNRKNIMPEYKSGRNIHRITNWEIFDNLEEEEEAKYGQIARLIQYLKCVPVKTLSMERCEADDVISYIAQTMDKELNSKIFIVSNDKDYFQLINKNITVFKPTENKYYGESDIKSKYGLLSSNFIIYKTLLGDGSDKIEGVKGLGEKGILKKFPELVNEQLSLENIFEISEQKLKEHIVYARILQDRYHLENSYKIMNLHDPFIYDKGKEQIKEFINELAPPLQSKLLAHLYNDDQLVTIIRNLDFWIKETFTNLSNFNK